MADKLNWLNQHQVLKLHSKVDEVAALENYELPFELAEIAKDKPEAEYFTSHLFEEKKYTECIKFLSYNMHKRALAWWAYCCVLNLCSELKVNPEKEVDIADIARPKEMVPPDWAKMPEMPKINNVNDIMNDPQIKKSVDELNKAKAYLENELKKYPQEWIDEYNEIEAEVNACFARTYGKDPQGMIQDFIDMANKDLNHPLIDTEKSPIFKASNELKDKIEAARQKAVKDIKKALPKKDPKETAMKKANAMNAAYAYIAAPNDTTAKRCLDVGNACPDTPEGLLSLVCFWSYGNMMPNPDSNETPVVPTPPGLAANGFNSLILMCCLAKGGVLDFERREYTYLAIGKDIMNGRSNWGDYLSNTKAPHENLFAGEFNGVLDNNELNRQLTENFGEAKTAPLDVKNSSSVQSFRLNRFR